MLKPIVAVAIAIASASTAEAVVVSFSNTTTDSYASNFTQLVAGSSSTVTQDNTNGWLVHANTSTTVAQNLVAVYDTNPTGATTFSDSSFSVSTVVTLNSAVGSSFGFFIGTRTDATANDMLALLNVFGTGTADTLRFSPNGNFASNVAGTLAVSASEDTALSVGTPITLTLTVTGGNSFVLSATDGTTTLTSASAYTGYTLPANYEIGFRTGVTNNANGTANATADDFTVTSTAVPEPTGLALVAIGIVGGLARRPRSL